MVTLLVDDLDQHVAGLAERGFETGPVEEIPGVKRSIWVVDPDGNRIQLGKPG